MAIGKLFHIIHMTGDLPALEAWYDDVFSVRRGFMDHNYAPGLKRDASLLVLGDAVIEALSPAFRDEGWDALPLGRFYKRFGTHWHSIAWYTDDVSDLRRRCTDAGIRVVLDGPEVHGADGPAYPPMVTHPKDTFAQLEFVQESVLERLDPRLRQDWDPDWWVHSHPLGLQRLAYTTVVTSDIDRARHIYADVLGGTPLHDNVSELTGTANSYVLMGNETVVELATPVRDGTIAAAELAAFGNAQHAATFKVSDLDRAAKYLASKGITVTDRDELTLVTDPATTHGVPFRWTTWTVPGDPRGRA
jgi:catechol 2,3-dioxygenase-like lactoylglutathione lyase family enzyme